MHGYDNPWPAGGGANKWDEEWELGKYDTTNGSEVEASDQIRAKNLIPVIGSAQYFAYTAKGSIWALFYDASQNLLTNITIDDVTKSKNAFNISNKSFTMPTEAAYMKFYMTATYGATYNNDIAINYPATVTTYSPYSNECPISGWTGANIEQRGKNLINPNTVTANSWINIDTGSVESGHSNYVVSDYIQVKEGQQYVKSGYGTNRAYLYTADKTPLMRWSSNVITIPSNAYYARITVQASLLNASAMVEVGSIASTFAPYTGNQISINWQTKVGTIYGGTVTLNEDGSADVLANYALKTFDGSEKWGTYGKAGFVYDLYPDMATSQFADGLSNMFPVVTSGTPSMANIRIGNNSSHIYVRSIIGNISGVTDLTTWKAFLANNNLQVTYPLATPQTYHFDNIGQLNTFIGTNNVWADTGDVTVTYIANSARFSFNSPLHRYNFVNLKLFGNTYIEHGKG